MRGAQIILWGTVLALGVTSGLACAGKRRGSQSPAECMQSCEQERCEYTPDAIGDNTEYLECLESCEDKCN